MVVLRRGEEKPAACRSAVPRSSRAAIRGANIWAQGGGQVYSVVSDYLTHGTGYFRMGMVRPLIDQGRLRLVPDSPEFSYPSYIVHSTNADASVMAEVRGGLRAAAAASL